MKRTVLSLLFLFSFMMAYSQQVVNGVVIDENGLPLWYVNVFIKETLEGASSDEEGKFSFTTSATSEVTLSAMMLGYETYHFTFLPPSGPFTIQLKPSGYELKEVEIIAGTFNLQGSSKWKTMNAVDVVTVGGSVGDLYNSLNTLPGTQTVGESGKLFIRGGDSREAQTYIDDMHVLNPYTTTGENEPVRGRYSPFMFAGMTFSLGGYDPEYAQGLSSVLPLSTKDESPVSKYGVNFSSVGGGGGGTYAFDEGSASVNLDYQNMGPYYSIFKDGREWINPYQKFSGSTQLRYHPTTKGVAKIYGAYDRTSYKQQLNHLPLQLKEDNYYLNSTYRHISNNRYEWFAGAAFSYNDQQYSNVILQNDLSATKEWEIHVKTKVQKRYSSLFKMQIGVESMIRKFEDSYQSGEIYNKEIQHSINGAYGTGSFYLTHNFNVALSSRLEYTTLNGKWNYTPRIAFNYNLKDFHFSAIAGKYYQLPENDYLFLNKGLASENCMQYIVGTYHESYNRIYRAEAYYKKYDRLALLTQQRVTSEGYGYSKGFDLFFNDAALIKNLEYRIAYSFNLSERKYGSYPVKDVPQYATKHNSSVSLRYNLNPLNSIIGITNQYATGRPYHDPNREGWMNGHTPSYNSLNLSWTWLVSKKVIIFGSASNILGRDNIYNYNYSASPDMNGHYQATAVKSPSKNFFFVGVFITLGGNTAYDVSNF